MRLDGDRMDGERLGVDSKEEGSVVGQSGSRLRSELSPEQLVVAEQYYALRKKHPWIQQKLVAFLAGYGAMTMSSLFRYKRVSDVAVRRAKFALDRIEADPDGMHKLLDDIREREVSQKSGSGRRQSLSPRVARTLIIREDEDVAENPKTVRTKVEPNTNSTPPRRPRSPEPILSTVSAAVWDILSGPEEQQHFAALLQDVPTAPGMMPLPHEDTNSRNLSEQVLVERAYDAYVRTRWGGERALGEPTLVPIVLRENPGKEADEEDLEVISWDIVTDRGKKPEDLFHDVGEGRAELLAEQVRKQLGAYGVTTGVKHPYEDRRKLCLQMELDDDDGRRRVLREELDWDLAAGEDLNSPEWFAQCLCTELALGEKNVRLVADQIRQQLRISLPEPPLPEVKKTRKKYSGTIQASDDAYVVAREVIYEALGRTFGCVDLGVKTYEPEKHALASAPLASGNSAAVSARRLKMHREQQHQLMLLDPIENQHGLVGSYMVLDDMLGFHTSASSNKRRHREDYDRFGGISPGNRTVNFGKATSSVDKMDRGGSPSSEHLMSLACSYPGCGRRFKWVQKLQQHEASHYEDNSQLSRRIRSLQGSRNDDEAQENGFREETRRDSNGGSIEDETNMPNKCPYANCSRRFGWPSELQRHIEHHERERHPLKPEVIGSASSPLRGSFISTRRSNPLPPNTSLFDTSTFPDGMGLDPKSSLKAKITARKEKKDVPKPVRPAKPPPPVVNVVVHGLDLSTSAITSKYFQTERIVLLLLSTNIFLIFSTFTNLRTESKYVLHCEWIVCL